MTGRPIRVTVVDDFDVIVRGVAQLLQSAGGDEVEFVELVVDEPVAEDVDVVLFDTFAQGEAHTDELVPILTNEHAANVAVYTWEFADELVQRGLDSGLRGYLSKSLGAPELLDAVRRIAAGEVVVAGPDGGGQPDADRPWPGQEHGLTEREAEVLSLIATGRSNADIAEMLYLSENSVKRHVRTAYRRIGVESRTQAVLWAVDNGLRPEHRRVSDWQQVVG